MASKWSINGLLAANNLYSGYNRDEMNNVISLAVVFATVTYAAEVVNVAPGIFSKRVVSNGLQLPASNTSSPVNVLTT